MSDERIGLLGGTFDPPHLGHLIAADVARVSLELDVVHFVVAGQPWMKAEFSDPEERVAMVELAVRDDPNFVVNRLEVDRPGVTYTVETLEEFAGVDPDAALFFLLGDDAAARLPEWREVEKAMELATFVTLSRPGQAVDLSGPILGDLLRVEMPEIGISSTDLRRRFADGDAVRYQLPPAVEEYVRLHGLYGAAKVEVVG